MFKRLLTICFFVTLFYLAFPSFAYAYLDPGTGSYIIQLLVAGIAGLIFVVKVYGGKIKTFFAGLFPRNKKMKVEDENGKPI